MTPHPAPRQIERLVAQLGTLRDGAIKLEQAYAAELGQIEPSHRASARNFLHYLSIRQHDIRSLQQDLGSLGPVVSRHTPAARSCRASTR
jgi:pyruvate kinase